MIEKKGNDNESETADGQDKDQADIFAKDARNNTEYSMSDWWKM